VIVGRRPLPWIATSPCGLVAMTIPPERRML